MSDPTWNSPEFDCVIFNLFFVDLEIQFPSLFMSDPTHSDIDFKKIKWFRSELPLKILQIVSETVPVRFLDVLTRVPVTENVSMDVHVLSIQTTATWILKISHQIMVTSLQVVTTSHAVTIVKSNVRTVTAIQVLINSTYSAPFYTFPFLFYLTCTFKHSEICK